MKIYITPMTDPETTTLQADVATWRALLDIQPIPRGSSISHVQQSGERFSQAEWRDIHARITRAVDGKDDDAVVRIWFDRDVAARLVDAARG